MKHKAFLYAILLTLLSACEKETDDTAGQIGIYSPQEIQSILTEYGFDVPFTLTHSVKAVKIRYKTPEPGGKLVEATGAIYLPDTEGNFPVISFQHGTQTQRYLVPSMGPRNSEAGLAGAIAASMGYVCVAADYLGLAESDLVPPFLLAENSAKTVIDMLQASYDYLEENGIQTDGNLYLTGYSQGGHVTLATLIEIEKNYSTRFNVSGCAPLAGPYDLKTMIDTVLEWGWYTEPILFAYMMNSYDHYYGWDRLNEIFREPYASEIPGYFNGTQLMQALRIKLPKDLDKLLTEQFITDYKSGGETDFRSAVRENSLMDYIPQAPVYLAHGDMDSTVLWFNATNLGDTYAANGKSNYQVSLVEGNHEDAANAAIVEAMAWIELMQKK